MGSGRDKRKKNKPSKPGQGAEKTERKTLKAEDKRFRRQERAADGDEDDIDAILAGIKLQDEAKVAVDVRVNCSPPSERVNCTFTALPGQRDTDLILFGGEHFDGSKTRVYGDLYRFNATNNTWSCIVSPNTPPPRSAHQAWVLRGHYYVFGGEFTSPNQERFHHYKDLWRLDLATNEWEQLHLRGAPTARSGHRVAVYKQKALLFGGFYDAGKEVRYYSDMYELDLEELTWTPIGKPGDFQPSARSACQLAVHESTMFLYGGYCKRKEDDDVGVGQMEKGTVHSDMWALDLNTYKWDKVKKAGMPPGQRAGFTMAVHRKQAILFGGVVDMEKDRGEIIVSEFFNETYTFQMATRRWFPLVLRSAKQAKWSQDQKAQEDKDSLALLRQDKPKSALDAAATKIQAHYRGHIVRKAVRLYKIGGIVSECLYSPGTGLKPPRDSPRPIGRINAAMCVRNNTLFLFGGMLELGDVEITLDDMWSLDLSKLNEWTCLKELTTLPDDLKPVKSDSEPDSDREQ